MKQDSMTDRALERAQLENKPPDSTYDFRIDAKLKADAKAICMRHGVSLGAFLRATLAERVAEYGE